MIAFELTDGVKTFLYRYPEKPAEITLDKLIGYEQKIGSKKPEILQKLEELTKAHSFRYCHTFLK